MHSLDVISFGLVWKKLQELCLFCFEVNWGSTLWQAAWRVWSEAEKVTEDIWGSSLLVRSPLGVSSLSGRWSVLEHSCDLLRTIFLLLDGSSLNLFLQVFDGRHQCAWIAWLRSKRLLWLNLSWFLEGWPWRRLLLSRSSLGRLNWWSYRWLDWRYSPWWWYFLLWCRLLRSWRRPNLLFFGVVEWSQDKSRFYHRKLFVIFTKITVEFIIIHIVEKSDPLSKGLSLSISEILHIERNRTDLRKTLIKRELGTWL